MSVAGTPLPLPRAAYTATDPRDGLTATLTPSERNAWSNLEVTLGPRRANFRCYLGSNASAQAHWRSLRALLIEHRLLTRPSLVTGRDTDGATDDARALLRDLRDAWRGWAENLRVSCDACNERNVRRGAGWYDRQACDHVDLWRRGWERLGDAHPELVFAVVGVLTQAHAPDDARRWVLSPQAHEGALAALFDASATSVVRGAMFGGARRWSRPRRRAGEGRDPLDEARRFAAAAWGDRASPTQRRPRSPTSPPRSRSTKKTSRQFPWPSCSERPRALRR